MDSAQIPEITNDSQPQITEQNNSQFGLIITIFLIIIIVGFILLSLFTEDKSSEIVLPDNFIEKGITPNQKPNPTYAIEESTSTPSPSQALIATTIPSIIATPLIEQLNPTITPNNTKISNQLYYKEITRGANLLNNISPNKTVILFNTLKCELLEAENLGRNFQISDQKIQVNETDWFVKIKVKVTNSDSFYQTLALDLTDGIENIYLSEFTLDGQSSYPENIQPNSTKIIEVVMQVTNPHDKIYLLPRGYSSQGELEIIPLDI